MRSLNQIELFVRCAEAGSFSQIARELHLAPSSISRQISSLEEELGTLLFVRSTRRISLTEAGQLYYEKVRLALMELDEAKEALSGLQAQPQGILRLSVAAPLGEKRIIPLIRDFLEQYPEIELDLVLSDREQDMIKERIDLAIRIGRLADSSIIARKLADNRFILCTSEGYIQRFGSPQSIDDLSKHNCLVNSKLAHPNHWVFQRNQQQQKVVVSGSLVVNSGMGLYQAVCADLGIALLPVWLVAEEIKEGRIITLLNDYEVSISSMQGSGIYALYPAGRFLPPKVRVLLDYLIERF